MGIFDHPNSAKGWKKPAPAVIKRLIRESNMTYGQVAKSTGLTRIAVYYYVSGARQINYQNWRIICECLNLPIDRLPIYAKIEARFIKEQDK